MILHIAKVGSNCIKVQKRSAVIHVFAIWVFLTKELTHEQQDLSQLSESFRPYPQKPIPEYLRVPQSRLHERFRGGTTIQYMRTGSSTPTFRDSRSTHRQQAATQIAHSYQIGVV